MIRDEKGRLISSKDGYDDPDTAVEDAAIALVAYRQAAKEEAEG